MTKEEWIGIVKVLKASYTSEHFIPDKESNMVWYEMLKDLDCAMVKQAVVEYVCKEHFPPTIADIRTNAVKRVANIPSWESSWAKVVKCVGTYGRTGYKEAKAKLTDIEISCIDDIGWYVLCTTTNLNAERDVYRKVYENHMSNKLDRVIVHRQPIASILMLGDGNEV